MRLRNEIFRADTVRTASATECSTSADKGTDTWEYPGKQLHAMKHDLQPLSAAG